MKKLIAVDVDGTLVNSQKKITPKTREALIRASSKGHQVMIVSGRQIAGLVDLAREIGFDKYGGLISAFNGGMIFDYKNQKILTNHTLDINLAKEILNFCKDLDLEIMVPHDDCIITDRADSPYIIKIAQNLNVKLIEVKDIHETLDFEPNKFLFAADADIIDYPIAKLNEKFGDKTVQVKSSRNHLELMPPDISKGKSLVEAAKILGVDKANIIVFGDQMNDISMLEVAGVSVAMGNAVEPIKELADFVTKSNDEDGIAYYLENFLFNENK